MARTKKPEFLTPIRLTSGGAKAAPDDELLAGDYYIVALVIAG